MIVKEAERAEEKKEKQKKKQKQIIKRRNERKNIELDSPNVAAELPWRCPLLSFFVCLWIFVPNRQVPKGVGTEMRALVAFWCLLLHDEGAWSAVELKPRVSRVGGRGAAVLTCLDVSWRALIAPT